MFLLQLILIAFVGLITLVYLLLRHWFSYWANRGILHEKPVLFYGNLREIGRTQALHEPFRDFYLKYRGQAPFGGFYLFLRRAALILDLELVKRVLITDFVNFAHRGSYYNEKDDPISGHLFNLDGPKWRTLRTKLTPTFTSGKMKFMQPTIVKVAEELISVLAEDVQKLSDPEAGLELKEYLARFTTDVIGTCAFGLECNSLRDPQAEFRIMGKRSLGSRRHGRFVSALIRAFPDVARRLHIKSTRQDVVDFFMRIVRETVDYREREGVKRNDFMDILLELKQQNATEGFTVEQIAAQVLLFFIAGFETSSSTMTFALYELALNMEIQERARKEVEAVLEEHKSLSYEAVQELKYLKQILHETMRKHSIATILLRKCLSDYQVPNSKYIIEKGTMIIIPVTGIHYDPDIYDNPEVFDPGRFTPAEVEKRPSVAWLPFGDGPRNCIGLRFGEMQAIIGMALLLKNFRFSPGTATKIPLTIDKKSFLLSPEGGMILKVEKL